MLKKIPWEPGFKPATAHTYGSEHRFNKIDCAAVQNEFSP